MNFFSLLFVSFPETILVTVLGFLLIGIEPRWRDLLIIGAIQALNSFIVRYLPVPFGLHSILEILLYTLNIRLITRLPYYIVILVSLLGLILYGSIETIIAPFMLYVTGYSLSDVLERTFIRILFFLPQALIMLVFILAIKYFKISLISYSQKYNQSGEYFSNIINKQNLLINIIILMPLLLLIILNVTYNAFDFSGISDSQINIFAGLIGVIIAILAVMSAAAVKKIGYYAEKEYEARRAVEDLNQIEQLINSSRKQRHDFYHQLQTVYGLLESGSYERARDFAKNYFTTVLTTRELIKTDNLSISALLNTKVALAEAQDIDLEITVECSLRELPLAPLEASSLLGNLIDNALEAVKENTGGRRQVEVSINWEHGAYLITCANPGDTIAPEVVKNFFKSDFTTKEGHSGLGLAIIKDIVTKYRGSVDVSSEDQEITFTVEIPFKR
ncbi:MAG: GHKL domain-containing protein [Desulfotomaculaceae bacterium]|nr:GHKL domain-containing protein [Desulfotomaculaceae bacterium]